MVENAKKREFKHLKRVKLRYALLENFKIIYISPKQSFNLY
jgi:hypothetical protein